jgi:hypothetical protein
MLLPEKVIYLDDKSVMMYEFMVKQGNDRVLQALFAGSSNSSSR